MGPLIFVLCINDFSDFITDGIVCMYADDTSVIVTAPDLGTLISNIKTTVDQFSS